MNGGRKYHASIYTQKDVACLGIQLSKQVSFAITLQKSSVHNVIRSNQRYCRTPL